MKKILSIGVLTLASMWLTPGISSAGSTFGLFTQTSCWPFNCFAHCECCKSTICIKPYNAFSPPCCDGLAVLGNGCGRCQSALAPLQYGSLPSVGSCCDGETTGIIPPVIPGAIEQAPVAPTPAPAKASPITPSAMNSYGPMQIGYSYPTLVPAYNYGTQPMAVPYYWNSKR